MNNSITVEVIVEGLTENKFIKEVLAPYWALRGIYTHAPVIRTREDKKAGIVYKGGNIRFERIKTRVAQFLKQRSDTLVASFVDFYGIKEWPGLEQIQTSDTPEQIAQRLNSDAYHIISNEYAEWLSPQRYYPFTAVHEFEAFLFSDSRILSEHLSISQEKIDAVLEECGSPEAINNSYKTAPSKRLEAWTNGVYGKTTDGVVIAKAIGIERIRRACPNFDVWLKSIEALQPANRI